MSANRPQSWLNIETLPLYHGGKAQFAGKAARAKLSSNENPLGASRKARAAMRGAVRTSGLYPREEKSLVEALARHHKAPIEKLLCTPGSGECLRLLAHAFLQAGDEAIMRSDGFSLYAILTLAQGAKPVRVASKDWRLDVPALIGAITKKTRLVFLANPDNPTGSFLGRQDLYALHEALPADVLLVLDGAYAEYGDEAMTKAMGALATSQENVVMVRTFSKLYGLAGLRLGWACGSELVMETLRALRLPYALSSVSVAAGRAALGDQAHMEASRKHVIRWRLWLREKLQALGLEVPPSAANFLLIKFPSAAAASTAWETLARGGILLRHLGEDYGMDDCLRVSIGKASDNRRLVRLLTRWREAQ